MVAPFPTSPVTAGALWLPLRSAESARAFLGSVLSLERSRGAIELSVARVLAWLHGRDPLELGSVTWTAFCGQHVDWGGSWTRTMIRLVESPHDKVKAAVAAGLLPVRRAVLAPGRVAVADQEAWLAKAVLGKVEADDAQELESFSGKDAEIIRRARHLGRLLLGWAAPPREVDAYIVRCWHDRVPLARLLSEARTPPPPPPPAPPFDWMGDIELESVAQAMERLERGQATLRGLTAVLARAWSRVNYEHLYEEAGFDTAADAAQALLGISLRSAQRLSALGWGLEWYPEIDAAIRAGMAPRTAAALLEVVGDNDASRWLDLAARVGRREFLRAVSAAREERTSLRTLERYREAAAIAGRWAASAEGKAMLDRPFGAAAPAGAAAPIDTGAHATTAGGPPRATAGESIAAVVESADLGATIAGGPLRATAAESIASVAESADLGATIAGGPPPSRAEKRDAPDVEAGVTTPPRLGIALRHPEPETFRGTSLRAPPDMLAAARWFLDTVARPPLRGFAEVKTRDGDRCTNPECGCRSLRTEAHHLIRRAHGGPDELWNGTGACRACHLRGLHGGHLEAVRVIVEGHDAVLFTWRDGHRVLRFRDEPGQPSERA